MRRRAAARLFEPLGDPRRALAAVRERPYRKGWPRYRSAALLKAAELALAMGDEGGGLGALDREVALRGDPEPPLRPAADRARRVAERLRAAGGTPWGSGTR